MKEFTNHQYRSCRTESDLTIRFKRFGMIVEIMISTYFGSISRTALAEVEDACAIRLLDAKVKAFGFIGSEKRKDGWGGGK